MSNIGYCTEYASFQLSAKEKSGTTRMDDSAILLSFFIIVLHCNQQESCYEQNCNYSYYSILLAELTGE